AQPYIMLFHKLLHLPAPPFQMLRRDEIRRLSDISASSNSDSSTFLSTSGDRCRLSMPPMATEIAPVSSDTTISTLSADSLMPTAARCRVPRSRERVWLPESGSTQPAA